MMFNFETANSTKVLHNRSPDLGDDPSSHRWRASWVTSWGDDIISGINLDAYPVLRLTPTGAWVDPHAYRQATKQPWEDGAPGLEWITHRHSKRWVGNSSGSAWAKPTQEAAIRSIAIRLMRWAQKCANDHAKVMAAVETLQAIRPDMKSHAEAASWALRSISVDHRIGNAKPEEI